MFFRAIAVLCAIGVCTAAANDSTHFWVAPFCSEARNCTAVLDEVFAQCVAADVAGWCIVQLSPGTYHMELASARNPRGPAVNGGRRIRLQGAGANATLLMFADLAFAFDVAYTDGIIFADFSVDMVRVPYTLGRVAAVNGSWSTFTVDQDLYPTDAATVARYGFLNRAQALLGYVPSTERYTSPDVYRLSDPIKVEYNNESHMLVNMKMPLGAWVVVRHQVYVYNVFNFVWAKNVRIERVVLLAAGGMGLYADACTNMTLDGFEVRRKRFPSGAVRAMSITADGIHICNSAGGTVDVNRCVLEGQGDDGMNINTRFARIVNISADRKTLALSTRGANPGSYFWNGCGVVVFDGRTMVARGPVNARVVDFTATTIELDHALPSHIEQYDLIINEQGAVDRVTIRNSHFLNNRARGALVKQGNATIENNVFSGMTSPALLTQADGCYWMEGRPFANWVARNNSILGADIWGPHHAIHVDAQVPVFENGAPTTRCVSVSTPGVYRGVELTHNHFVGRNPAPPYISASAAVYAADGVAIRNNTVQTTLPSGVQDFALHDCTHAVVAGNECRTLAGAQRACKSP